MRKAIYPGSFDPITNGHMDVVTRAEQLFDKIHIVVFDNTDKKPLFSSDERVDLIQELFKHDPKVVVQKGEGLLADFAIKTKIFTIVRGIRALSDFDFEFQMALTNRKLQEKIDTVFLMTDAKYSYLSSSMVKQIAQFQGNIDQFVPALVKESLIRKCNHE